MYTGDLICHTSSIEVDAGAQQAFDYLSDGVAQGEWALGSVDRERIGEHLYKGVSTFDGAELFIEIEADPKTLIILYHIGQDREAGLQPRNMIRVVAGPVVGKGDQTCVVTLLSWRPEGMPDERWKLICVSHETEMFIIKNRIESRL